MHIKSTINGILRAYPIVMMYSTMMLYIMSSDLDYLYLLIVLWIGEGINYNLKYNFFKPIFGDNIPFLGRGARPYAAKDCGLFLSRKQQKKLTSYGMPSGHSQNIAMFSTYMILKLLNSTISNNIKTIGYIFFIGLTLYIMWSRVYMICHTVQQTIVGSSIGILLGYSLFNVIRKEPSYFS